VRIIAPYAPGGVTDFLAREIGTALTQRIGTTFIVENRPGGGGNIGLTMLARAAPDGYTIGEGAANTLVANHFLYRTRAFETLRDFVPIAFVGRLPFVLVAHPSVAATNLRSLVAEMKARRLSYSYGSSGVGNTAHVFGELLAKRAGLDLVHVPYKSSGEALRDLIAGRTQLQFITPVELAGPIQQGAVRAIAVAAPARIAGFAEVPTLDEQGFRGFESPTWFGFIGPAGMPAEIVSRLNHEIREILATPATRARLARAGLEFQDMTVEQFRAFIAAEMTQWEGIVRDAGVHLD
jgi:tripartite-type tricarboxylate transporter receptor subunit TctC